MRMLVVGIWLLVKSRRHSMWTSYWSWPCVQLFQSTGDVVVTLVMRASPLAVVRRRSSNVDQVGRTARHGDRRPSPVSARTLVHCRHADRATCTLHWHHWPRTNRLTFLLQDTLWVKKVYYVLKSIQVYKYTLYSCPSSSSLSSSSYMNWLWWRKSNNYIKDTTQKYERDASHGEIKMSCASEATAEQLRVDRTVLRRRLNVNCPCLSRTQLGITYKTFVTSTSSAVQ